EARLRQLDREERRLLDAYQAEALDVAELQERRAQIAGRRQVLAAQREQQTRLRAEQHTAREVWADLKSFCERTQARLDESTLADRQRLLQLLIERVIVEDDTLEIRHVIPLRRPGPEGRHHSGGRPQRRTGTSGGPAAGCARAIAFGWCARHRAARQPRE